MKKFTKISALFVLSMMAVLGGLSRAGAWAEDWYDFDEDEDEWPSWWNRYGENPRCPNESEGQFLTWTVLLPNPEDCNSFFSCSNGVPILMNCPDGLHFNDKLDVCDWPKYAGCDPKYAGNYTILTKEKKIFEPYTRWDPISNEVVSGMREVTIYTQCCQSGGYYRCEGGSCDSLGPEWT